MKKLIDGKLNPELGLNIGGSLDLRGTVISTLPGNLYVGRSLYLEGTAIENYPVVYNCGNQKRAIYIDLEDKSLIRIGCFKGTQQESIDKINQDYEGQAAKDYIDKVKQCFSMI